MASCYQVEVNITSAKDLKHVNWCHNTLNPYAVVLVDPNAKSSSDGGPLTLLEPPPPHESTLHVDIVHAHAGEDTKLLIGSVRLPLTDVVAVDLGANCRAMFALNLKAPLWLPPVEG